MKKILLILFVLFLVPKISIGQSNYIKGGVITFKRDTILGFVDDQEWVNNPVKVGFKTNLTDKEQIFQSSDIQGFFVASSGDTYVSKTVEYEKLSRNIKKTSYGYMTKYYTREKDIRTQSAFLRVISTGKMNLYQFTDEDKELYYFLEQDSKSNLLTYHYFQANMFVQEIKEFQNQLKTAFSDCRMLSDFDFSKLNYTSSSLRKIVDYYNNCNSLQSVSTKHNSKNLSTKPWQLGLQIGAGYSKLQYNIGTFQFSSSLNPQIGIFINYVLPRQRGRFAFQNEVHYYSYNSKLQNVEDLQYTGGGFLKTDWSNEAIRISFIGLKNLFRYTFYQKKMGIYTLAGISNGFVINNNSTSGAVNNRFYDIRSHEEAYLIGLGSNFGKFSIESRLVRGNGISPFTYVSSPSSEIGLILKYQLN